MTRSIALLGSTGSIGRQTLEVARELGLSVAALTANRSVDLIEQQAREFSPRLAVLYDEDAARELRARLSDTKIQVLSGMEGLLAAATWPRLSSRAASGNAFSRFSCSFCISDILSPPTVLAVCSACPGQFISTQIIPNFFPFNKNKSEKGLNLSFFHFTSLLSSLHARLFSIRPGLPTVWLILIKNLLDL